MRRKKRNPKSPPACWPAMTVALAASICAGGAMTAAAQSLGSSLSDSSLNALASTDTIYSTSNTQSTYPNTSTNNATATTGTSLTGATTTSANTATSTAVGDLSDGRAPGELKTPRENLRTGSIDGLRTSTYDPAAPGIQVGAFVIRPTLSQRIGGEKTVSGGSSTHRIYSETGIEADITSDWSRHQLTITGAGAWQKNIAGTGETKPSVSLDAKLRLDVSRDTTVNFTGGYSFARESSTDPNSVSNASVQSAIHSFKAGIEGIHEFGVIRGTIGASLNRSVYGPATLVDGTLLSLSDRNETTGELRLRAGYELSPVLTPFIEVSAGKVIYDQAVDTSGYRRNARYYAGKAGLSFDFGDKLRGELAGGYKKMYFQDARLASIGALTIDGNTTWSPQRGTDVSLGVSTSIDPSTTAGTSGSTAYSINASVSQQMIDDLVARLSGSATRRKYGNGATSNQTEWVADAGLTWSMNRYTDLTADFGWNYTNVQSGTDTTVWSAIAGVKFKR